MEGGAALPQGVGSRSEPTRCEDCQNTVCALRGRCSAPAAAAGRAPRPPRPSPLHRLAHWYGRPAVRHRVPLLLALAGLAVPLWRHAPHGPALAGFAACAVLALWWSAPRATPAGWPALTVFAAAAGLLTARAGGGLAWIPVAVGLAVAAARLNIPAALGAWALCAAAIAAAALLAGAAPPLIVPVGCGLGTAAGLIVAERRRSAAREQNLLHTVAELTARAELAEAGIGRAPGTAGRHADAGAGPSVENPRLDGPAQGGLCTGHEPEAFAEQGA